MEIVAGEWIYPGLSLKQGTIRGFQVGDDARQARIIGSIVLVEFVNGENLAFPVSGFAYLVPKDDPWLAPLPEGF